MKRKTYLFLSILCVFAVPLYAQAPAITSISPESGPVGTEVTITGTGFLSSGNVIYFRDALMSMLYEARITASSPDGLKLLFDVPQAVNPECYYSDPPCASPSRMVSDGVYLVYVVTSAGTSNMKEFTVSDSPTQSPSPAALPTTDPDCPSGIYGDANEDGEITIADALIVAQTYVGVIGLFTPPCADVNGSGSVDILDALLIAQCYVGLISCDF
ncbi:MAG: IPT/TIG domain-containing protein [Spirochaetales bacterium]|nr:IPT/TIG domain-containing protein [Spirochaetales bacterium]